MLLLLSIRMETLLGTKLLLSDVYLEGFSFVEVLQVFILYSFHSMYYNVQFSLI